MNKLFSDILLSVSALSRWIRSNIQWLRCCCVITILISFSVENYISNCGSDYWNCHIHLLNPCEELPQAWLLLENATNQLDSCDLSNLNSIQLESHPKALITGLQCTLSTCTVHFMNILLEVQCPAKESIWGAAAHPAQPVPTLLFWWSMYTLICTLMF